MNKTAAFLLILAGIVLGAGVTHCIHSQLSILTTDTTSVIVRDTIHYRVPVAYDSVVTQYKTKYVKIQQTITDSVIVYAGDSIPVELPVTQKVYRDSLYEAWISGYEPQLDSINVFSRTITNTINKSVPTKAKRWGLGIQVGVGVTPSKIEPYVGVGVSYNILQW